MTDFNNHADQVVSLGIHILDVLGRPVTRIPPKQDVDLLEEIRLTVAGTAAGTSVDLAKLGANVLAMGAIGEDAAGNFIVDTMTRYGIDTRGLTRKPAVQTSATMLPIRPNGDRPALHVLGANAELTIDDIDFDAIANATHLHFGGTYLMPKLDGPPTARILAFAQERGVPITLDLIAIGRPDLLEVIEPALPYVDFFMPGLDEARMISGLHERQDVIRFFLDRGVRHTVLKWARREAASPGEARPPRLRKSGSRHLPPQWWTRRVAAMPTARGSSSDSSAAGISLNAHDSGPLQLVSSFADLGQTPESSISIILSSSCGALKLSP